MLSNVALWVLDEHCAREAQRPLPGDAPSAAVWASPNCRLVRYADDWTLMVAGIRDDAVALRDEAAQVLARTGLRLSEEKTLITRIDEGLVGGEGDGQILQHPDEAVRGVITVIFEQFAVCGSVRGLEILTPTISKAFLRRGQSRGPKNGRGGKPLPPQAPVRAPPQSAPSGPRH